MLSQELVLQTNDANVQLWEHDNQSRIEIRPASTLLPSRNQQTTAFDDNVYFKKARTNQKKFGIFLSKSQKSVLIVPTKPVASIRIFAKRASIQQWIELWTLVYHVRDQLQRRFGGFFYISTIGYHVPQLHIRIERRANIQYQIKFRPNVAPVDQLLILNYANDRQGWCGRFQCSIKKNESRTQKTDVVIQFATPRELESKFGSEFAQLSVSTIAQTGASRILFNLRNWNKVPKDFRGTLSTYRKYIVQHELGHALFHIWDHDEEPRHGTCPVMMQQTKGTTRCTPGIAFHPHETDWKKSVVFSNWLYSLSS